MKEEGGLFQSGELARKAGVSPRTVRYYEELGLLPPAYLTNGGLRLYTPAEVTRLRFIRRLKRLGLSLEEIKDAVGTPGREQSRQGRVEHTLEVLRLEQARLEKQGEELERLRIEVEQAMAQVSVCHRCVAEACPPNCPYVASVL
ncbi:MAG: MerR family transcriptional regulator [Chloroflexi bacterium]|nr:MerR family transcriptional regulator [Chloroflexota bacterium]